MLLLVTMYIINVACLCFRCFGWLGKCLYFVFFFFFWFVRSLSFLLGSRAHLFFK